MTTATRIPTATRVLMILKGLGVIDKWAIESIPSDEGYPAWDHVWGKGKTSYVSEETYGETSDLYFNGTPEQGALAADVLACTHGFEVNPNWCASDPGRFSIRVQALKGWHHWE